jgi:hypothetical protein
MPSMRIAAFPNPPTGRPKPPVPSLQHAEHRKDDICDQVGTMTAGFSSGTCWPFPSDMIIAYRLAVAAVIAGLLCLAGDRADAQIVQLPTFRSFGVSTTVSVPDRGSVSLGGISSNRSGYVERGLPILGVGPFGGPAFANRAIGRQSQTAGVSVSAYIHDFETLEQDLVERADARSRNHLRPLPLAAGKRSESPPRLLPSLRSPSAAPDVGGQMSIAELRRQKAASQVGLSSVATRQRR